MTEGQVISWIFLSIALSSQNEPVDIKGICSVADGINHAIPTNKELQLAIKLLTKNGLIERVNKNYSLTEKGKYEYELSAKKSERLSDIWKSLEMTIKNYA